MINNKWMNNTHARLWQENIIENYVQQHTRF
jgi:hypothetical protein